MDTFCRICSRSDEFQKFELSTISQISNVRIDDMLVYCTQQQINIGDSLPQHICAECFTALNSAFVFRKLTNHSENGFRQMINSNLTASDPMPSGIDLVPILPLEMMEHILPDVTIEEEELELGELLAADIIPVEFTEALSIEENLNSTSDPPDGITQPGKKRDKSKGRNFAGPTAYLCKDCGYTTQNCFNFKRHQKIRKHSTYSRIVTRHPLHMIKHMIRPKVCKPPKSARQKPTNPEKKAHMEHILPDVAVKDEELELGEPLAADIIPLEFTEALSIEENLNSTCEPPDGIIQPGKKRGRGKGKSIDGTTTYLCKDCGYTTQHCFNFKRHQKNQKHSNYSKIATRHPLHTNKHMIRPKVYKPPKPPKPVRQKPTNPEKKTHVEHILPDVAIKEEELELGEPLAADIIPLEFTEALSIEENLNSTCEPPDGIILPGQKRVRGKGKSIAATTYLCKDCGYTTQNCFNFKRHQTNQKHSNYSRIFSRHPLDTNKDMIKQFIQSKVSKPPNPPRQKPPKPKKKKPRKEGRHPRNNIRTLYRCDDCGYQNYISFNFRRHQKAWNHTKVTTFPEPETSSEETMLKCRECGDEFPSNAFLKAHRRTGCGTLANNLDPDYVYSDEALAICRSLGTKRTQVKREIAEQMVEVKPEPCDAEPPSAQVADGDS